jgi:hypothetical protein
MVYMNLALKEINAINWEESVTLSVWEHQKEDNAYSLLQSKFLEDQYK